MVLFLSQLQSITSDRQLKVVTNLIINFSLCDRSVCEEQLSQSALESRSVLEMP